MDKIKSIGRLFLMASLYGCPFNDYKVIEFDTDHIFSGNWGYSQVLVQKRDYNEYREL